MAVTANAAIQLQRMRSSLWEDPRVRRLDPKWKLQGLELVGRSEVGGGGGGVDVDGCGRGDWF